MKETIVYLEGKTKEKKMFETQEQKDNYTRAYELKREVDRWVSQEFNFINVAIYEKMADDCLFDHIRPIRFEDYIAEFLDSLAEGELLELIEEALEDCYKNLTEFVEEQKEDEVREFISDNSYDCDH